MNVFVTYMLEFHVLNCHHTSNKVVNTLNDTFNDTDTFFAIFSKLFKILVRNFQESEKNISDGFSSKITKINHCFFAPHSQVFRHNNPHSQMLQTWADLRQHSVSDKFIIY